MSGPPETFLGKIQNRLWRIRTRRPPASSSYFAGNVEPEDRMKFDHEIARLIFSNEGDLVHKWMHYLPIYERLFGHLRGKEFRFLEIGVSHGGSLKIWREYFGEKATIFGVDINPDCKKFDGKFGQVRIGSQDDPAFLSEVVKEMGGVDVVLDDGSHVASHQKASYNALFPQLSDDGLYVIEDLHTAYWPRWGGGLRRPGTAIELLKNEIDEMHRHYVAEGRNKSEEMAEIESIQFFDSIAVVHKRKQASRKHFMVPDPSKP